MFQEHIGCQVENGLGTGWGQRGNGNRAHTWKQGSPGAVAPVQVRDEGGRERGRGGSGVSFGTKVPGIAKVRGGSTGGTKGEDGIIH